MYLRLYLTRLQGMAAYRFDFLLATSYRIAGFFAFFYLWRLTAASVQIENELFAYFWWTLMLFSAATTGRMAKRICASITSGDFKSLLLKPINIIHYFLAEFLAELSVRIAIPMIITAFVFMFNPKLVAPNTIQNFVLFVFCAVAGIALYQLFMVCAGLMGFWVRNISNTLNVIDLSLRLFTGVLIPIYLYPQSFLKIVVYTPFYYFGAFQMMFFQNKLSDYETLKSIAIMLVYLLLAYIAAKLILRRGLNIYDATGS